MLVFLSQIDTQLFLFINHLPHNLILDSFFSLWTLVGNGGFIWMAIAILLFLKKKVDKKAILEFLSVGILVFFTGTFLKDLFRRPRPETSLIQSFSFPSGHAMAAFAFAYLLTFFDKKHRPWYYFLAILIAFSRVYLGQHYPGDVLVGGLLGLFIGVIITRFFLV